MRKSETKQSTGLSRSAHIAGQVNPQNKVLGRLRPARCDPDLLGHRTSDNGQRAAEGSYLNAGFTLMEIMLAIVILGLVVTTVLASFNSVFSTTEALESNNNVYVMAKNCLKQMIIDLESVFINQPPLYKPPEFDSPPDNYRLVGTTEEAGGTGFAKLRFTSRAHLRLENIMRDGIAEITYYAQAKEDGQVALKRSDALFPYPAFEERGSDPTLCDHVKSLAFKYYDDEGTEYEIWDSESAEFGYATPAAISIQLEIQDHVGVYTFATLVKLPVARKKIQ